MNNVFIQIDGLVIVRNFVVQVKQIVHDHFLLIVGNEEGMVLGRRVPMSENVIFECGHDHGQYLGLLIGDEQKQVLEKTWFFAVL
jgi:hypothetical protein